jgi:DNA repair exonuclease SbcCD ATPase subunit
VTDFDHQTERTQQKRKTNMSNSIAFRPGLSKVFVAGLALGLAPAASSQVLDRSIQTEEQIARNAAQVQAQINEVADETESLVSQYRITLSEIDSLRVYNDMLQDTVDSQEAEIENINQQLENLEQTNRDVVPLMIEMAETLPQLVQADVPFRVDERLERAESLIDALNRADVTTSEKFRRILEAYQSEIELGRTTEGYRGQLPDGQRVDFLRIGRTLLFYQSLDESETGWWNPNTRSFEQLDDRYRLPVSDGLAIAQNQVAPDLVRLPVPAPTEAE